MHRSQAMGSFKHLGHVLLTLVFPVIAFAETGPNGAPPVCPARLSLTLEEHSALLSFNARLSHLQKHYGESTFAAKLSDILETEWPTRRVIEVSPVFVERVLVMVDQQYLKDAVASTLGLDSEHWREFERVMFKVTLREGLTEDRFGAFTRNTQRLVTALQSISLNMVHSKNINDVNQLEIIKGRAISYIANLSITMNRWSLVHKELAKLRVKENMKHLTVVGIGAAAAGILIASVFVASPIIDAAGKLAFLARADVVLAANLARLMKVGAAAAIGIVGAPVTVLLADSTTALGEADRLSRDKGTMYICELDAQIADWKARGVSPYLSATAVGGATGAGPGSLALTRIGAKALLFGTSLGVGVAQAYSVGKLADNTMIALSEFHLARVALENGDRDSAIEHLHSARRYAQKQNQYALDSILMGTLTFSIGPNFLSALRAGGDSILALYASSSDTLPQAGNIVVDMFKSAAGRK